MLDSSKNGANSDIISLSASTLTTRRNSMTRSRRTYVCLFYLADRLLTHSLGFKFCPTLLPVPSVKSASTFTTTTRLLNGNARSLLVNSVSRFVSGNHSSSIPVRQRLTQRQSSNVRSPEIGGYTSIVSPTHRPSPSGFSTTFPTFTSG